MEWLTLPPRSVFMNYTECDLSAGSPAPPSFPARLTPSRTLLNKLGVKKCAHFKRFNRFAAARFDLCRQGRRRREPFMRLPLWSRQLLNGSTVGAAAWWELKGARHLNVVDSKFQFQLYL